MRIWAALTLLTASIAPAFAGSTLPPVGQDWGSLLLEVIVANGCKMAETDAPILLTPHGFEQDWTPSVLQQLIDDGRASLTVVNGRAIVTATTEACG